MNKPKLNRLPQELVNQIAAGEVVERPSSVVKELVDNSIDAGATKIIVKIVNGGIDLIEISDNGIGIPEENLNDIFDAHTTSKISSIEDLNTLMSMGFRGEALSTITSVAKVEVISKYNEEQIANSISIDSGGKSEIKKAAREEGTLISVKNLFYNIPARKKYLKTAQTEYRKIYELLNQYFLVFPNISFTFESDGKIKEELPAVENSKIGEITKERIEAVLNKDFTEHMLDVFYNGNGIEIQGKIAHPSQHKSRGTKNIIFINNRNIQDKGIYRAVIEGYSRFMPFGEKVSFVLNIKINPELVDVNVHPRKEEVRFQNPFRIYSAVENAVKHTLEKEMSYSPKTLESNISENKNIGNSFADVRERFTNKGKNYEQESQRSISFGKSESSVRDSLNFSKELLSQEEYLPASNAFDYQESQEESFEKSEIRNVFQIFNKYIVIEFENKNLWIMDQHAVAERINFEKLQNTHEKKDLQNLLVPFEISLNKDEVAFVEENKDFFAEIGFILDIKDTKILITSIPAEFAKTDFEAMFNEIFETTDNIGNLAKNFIKLREDILATISCHASIRKGQPLNRPEMINLYNELSECKNPYSCPHGRPAIWKLRLEEIDKNFERTY
jgi:DNA mismatch repair protein MutL